MSHPGGGDPVAPSVEDPWVSAGNEVVGGPLGRHAATGRSWWTPVRVLLVLVTVTFALGMAQKAPCVVGDVSYDGLCYTDIDKLYGSRGFAAGELPYLDDSGRYRYFEYPVLTGAFVYGAAVVTHTVFGEPQLAGVPADEVWSDPEVQDNIVPFTAVNAVLLFVCALVAVWALAKVHGRRPWDAALVAAAPVLALAGLVNWDLLAVALLALALLAWSRGRPGIAGVMVGLGTAAKLYPLFLLGPMLVLCARTGNWIPFARALAGAAIAWLVVNVPVMAINYPGWEAFWSFNSDRGADLGSLWYAWSLLGHPAASADTVNLVSWVVFGTACLAVAALGLLAPRRPRLPQLALLVVIAFLVVNKVYSPQYVLWLLPLAALARPRWRDLLVWQGCEAVYFAAIWVFLQGDLASATTDAAPMAYVLAIVVRVAGQIWLGGLVVRDILTPWRDPVRADGQTDDPAGGVLADAPDRPSRPRVLPAERDFF
ncbi:MAG TPA: glycosyltransferase 87 family protein [Nocardioidaceae bacterium]|nr:glycosyltransferase 87 family protein [Nocardioidaceae bacterium]